MSFDWIGGWTDEKLRDELRRCEASEHLKVTLYRDAVVAELKRRGHEQEKPGTQAT